MLIWNPAKPSGQEGICVYYSKQENNLGLLLELALNDYLKQHSNTMYYHQLHY